jgi:ATP-dependent DNA helicase RecQ
VLFFSAGDVVKQNRFIAEKSGREQEIAQAQLREMIHYAETRDCRRATLLKYFGEELSPPVCDGCDNCLTPRDTFDGTVPAQKFLSCVYRIHAKHGFGFGLKHIVDVLLGEETESVQQRGHDKLSTFGIGKDLSRQAWQAIGRELLRLGLVATSMDKFATLALTDTGLTALRERISVTLTKPYDVDLARKRTRKRRAGEIECDEALFEKLRAVRRSLADERGVPAYVIFSDASLREMAKAMPTMPAKFSEISGVGQQKLRDFGKVFIDAIADYVAARSTTSPA